MAHRTFDVRLHIILQTIDRNSGRPLIFENLPSLVKILTRHVPPRNEREQSGKVEFSDDTDVLRGDCRRGSQYR